MSAQYFRFFVSACGQSSGSRLGVVVEAKNFTLPAGSTAVLPCHSPRMVWTRDRLKDRQRVVHWDLIRSSPDYSAERVLDMSPGGRQRVYNSFNKGRISVPDSAFNDGNFSLVINSKMFFFLFQFISLLLWIFPKILHFFQTLFHLIRVFTPVIYIIITVRFTSQFKSSSMSQSLVSIYT